MGHRDAVVKWLSKQWVSGPGSCLDAGPQCLNTVEYFLLMSNERDSKHCQVAVCDLRNAVHVREATALEVAGVAVHLDVDEPVVHGTVAT